MHGPFGPAAVFQGKADVAVALEPANAPLRYHSTLVTPTLSEALTLTETTPDTVLPAAGAVMVAVGGVVSIVVFWTDTLSGADAPTLPAAS